MAALRKRYAAQAMRPYSAPQLVGLFFVFALGGWLWEVALRLCLDGILVNPGTMHGPWVPIYGAGGVLAVAALRRFAAHPLRLFALASGLCAALEYAAGRYLIAVYGLRWWDYSVWPLDVDGIVCLPVSLLFGLCCCAAVYVVAPAAAAAMERCSHRSLLRLCALALTLFALDLGWSTVQPNEGRGVSDKGAPVMVEKDGGNLIVVEVTRAAAVIPPAYK